MAADHDGAMVALYPDPATARRLALAGGESPDDMHVTLAYLGSADDLDEETLEAIRQSVADWASGTPPIEGEVSGTGLFTEGDEPVTYASVDAPVLPSVRQRLVEQHLPEGIAASNHGFTPHITLDYNDRLDESVNCGGEPLRFGDVALVVKGDRSFFPLAGKPVTASVSPRRLYRAPRTLELPGGLRGLSEAALRRLDADPSTPVGEWVAGVIASIDARVASVLESCDCPVDSTPTAYGLIDPEFEDGELVYGVFRPSTTDEAGIERWAGEAWEPVPPEYEPVGAQYVVLEGPLLTDALEAISSGSAGMLLRPTMPRAFAPHPPSVVSAAEAGGGKVYAIVDDLDNTAVLEAFMVNPGPEVARRDNGSWVPAPDILKQLQTDPPHVVEIGSDQVDSVLDQIDAFDSEQGVTAGATWTEDLHPRQGGKFAAKSQSELEATKEKERRQRQVENYVRSGKGGLPRGKPGASGPSPSTAGKKKAAQDNLSKALSNKSSRVRNRLDGFRKDWAVEDARRSLHRLTVDSKLEQNANLENADRERFAAGVSDEYVRVLNETGDPMKAQLAVSAKVKEEVARRKTWDAEYKAKVDKIRSKRKIHDAEIRLNRALRVRKLDGKADRLSNRARTADGGPPSHSMMDEHLKIYWTRGKGAARIRWGTGGDFNRCRRNLAKYLQPEQIGGACANLHKIATGTWPGKGRDHH